MNENFKSMAVVDGNLHFKNEIFEPVIKKCSGCARVFQKGQVPKDVAGNFCSAYMFPGSKWRNGNCPAATHVAVVAEVEVKINPLKAAKRGIREEKAHAAKEGMPAPDKTPAPVKEDSPDNKNQAPVAKSEKTA